MIRLKKSATFTLDSVFILALLALFGITSFFLIIIGARQYQSIADRMSENYETRTIASYLEEKLNQSDVEGSAAVTMIGSSDALALTQTLHEQSYTTYIYAYDGYLREITVTSGTAVSPESGQKIIETGALSITPLSTNLYQFTTTDTMGSSYSLFVSFQAN